MQLPFSGSDPYLEATPCALGCLCFYLTSISCKPNATIYCSFTPNPPFSPFPFCINPLLSHSRTIIDLWILPIPILRTSNSSSSTMDSSHPFSGGPWFCKHCQKPFSVWEHLVEHKKAKRNENKEDHIHCKFCGRDFHTLEGEMKHMQVVSQSAQAFTFQTHEHRTPSDFKNRSILLNRILTVLAAARALSSA